MGKRGKARGEAGERSDKDWSCVLAVGSHDLVRILCGTWKKEYSPEYRLPTVLSYHAFYSNTTQILQSYLCDLRDG